MQLREGACPRKRVQQFRRQHASARISGRHRCMGPRRLTRDSPPRSIATSVLIGCEREDFDEDAFGYAIRSRRSFRRPVIGSCARIRAWRLWSERPSQQRDGAVHLGRSKSSLVPETHGSSCRSSARRHVGLHQVIAFGAAPRCACPTDHQRPSQVSDPLAVPRGLYKEARLKGLVQVGKAAPGSSGRSRLLERRSLKVGRLRWRDLRGQLELWNAIVLGRLLHHFRGVVAGGGEAHKVC